MEGVRIELNILCGRFRLDLTWPSLHSGGIVTAVDRIKVLANLVRGHSRPDILVDHPSYILFLGVHIIPLDVLLSFECTHFTSAKLLYLPFLFFDYLFHDLLDLFLAIATRAVCFLLEFVLDHHPYLILILIDNFGACNQVTLRTLFAEAHFVRELGLA